MADLAAEWREQLVSTLFDYSDEVAELALAEAEIPPELVRKVVQQATIARLVVPVFGGSALDCIGVQPVMKVEVTVPEEHLGDVINDLQQRQAIITATELRGGATVLTVEAPLASMFGYSAAVRSVSQGQASFTMAPLKYGPASAETAAAYL